MNIDEIMLTSGLIIVFMIISIVIVFLLFTKKSIQNIQQREELLAQMQRAIIASQEAERETVANNLHDDFGAQMSVLSRKLKDAALPDGTMHLTPTEREEVYEWLGRIQHDFRKYSHDIFPTQLQKIGLVSSIEENVRALSVSHHAHFNNTLSAPLSFDRTTELTVYRIVNEVLNNFLKHAKATQLDCELALENNQFVLRLVHNGMRFTQENFIREAQTNQGKGCSSILNRTHVLNGTIVFDSQSDGLQKIELRIPNLS